jgi:single-strand DNA-binding protein
MLGGDAEQRQTPQGKQCVKMNVAVNGKERGGYTCWYKVTLWGDRWNNLAPHLKKGKFVLVHGKLLPPTCYQSKTGEWKASLDVDGEMVNFVNVPKAEMKTEVSQNVFEDDRPVIEKQAQMFEPASQSDDVPF